MSQAALDTAPAEVPAAAQKSLRLVRRNGLSEKQLEMRKTGLGGSEIGPVAGLSPWSSPLAIWRRKVLGEQLEENKHMRRGRLLEPAVADWYREETGARLRKVGTWRHGKRSFALATPDRIATINGAPRLLEIKTTLHAPPEEWGQSGTDEVPQHYLAQVMWTMEVAELDEADLAVLIGGSDFRLYHFKRSPELVGQLMELGERFWVDNVLAKRPPPPSGADNGWLKLRFPKDNGVSIGEASLTDEARDMVRRYLNTWAEQKAITKQLEDLSAQMRALLGEASELTGSGYRIDWKQNKPSTVTDWQGLALALADRVEPEAFRQLMAQWTGSKPGNRPLRPYILKGAAR